MNKMLSINRLFYIALLMTVLTLSGLSHAIGINKMFAVADQHGKATYTINGGNNEKRLFLSVTVSELKIEKDKISKIRYNRSNIDAWKVRVDPSRTILEPNFEKDIHMTLLCGDECPSEELVFQLYISPVNHIENPSDNNTEIEKNIDFIVGLSPIFVKPGPESEEFKISVEMKGDNLVFHNQGEGFNYVTLDDCKPNQNGKPCYKYEYIVLANRILTIPLPHHIDTENLNIKAFSNQRRFSTRLHL